MKDILIVGRAKHNPDVDTVKLMTTEAQESKVILHQPLENTWLLSGPKSFETAARILSIAHDRQLPVAVFEIESVLVDPTQDKKDNHQ